MIRKLTALIPLALALVLGMLLSLLFGGSALTVPEVFRGLLHPHAHDTAATILWNLRLPRVVLGMLVGMGLAASGCVFQGMLRNPLADPYTLGISGGAAFGTTLGIVTGFAALGALFLPLSAFLGTLLTIALVYAASSRKSFSLSTLILSGVILGFLFSALVLLIFSLTDAQKLQSTILWLMGDLSSADPAMLKIAAFCIVPGILLISLFGRELNILTLGDEKASLLGVETQTVKKALFIVSSFVAAACVAASGIIGFVGLVIPHAARRFVGSDHQVLIPASALAGGLFLVLCDAVARAVAAPLELPVGVVTGLIGGVFFVVFILKSSPERVL
ncbi:MAG: FecCD family ABC transporter permease [Endomicrobiales bacterium]